MKTELSVTYIVGQEHNWWRGECQCGRFSVHLPSLTMMEKYYADHLYLNHAEYAELGLANWLERVSA